MESFANTPKHNEGMGVAFLIESLAEVVGEDDVQVEEYDGTYEIDTDDLKLSFTFDPDTFVILNIEVSRARRGLGREVVEAIHSYADEYKLQVEARKVKDGATGFWKALGYEQGTDEEDTYYRCD